MKTNKIIALTLLLAGMGLSSCGGDSGNTNTTDKDGKRPNISDTRPMEPVNDALNPGTKAYVPQIDVAGLKTEEQLLDAMDQVWKAKQVVKKMEKEKADQEKYILIQKTNIALLNLDAAILATANKHSDTMNDKSAAKNFLEEIIKIQNSGR